MKNCVLGAILDENNADVEVAFKFAAIRENIYGTKHDLVPNIQKVDIENVHAVQEAGKLKRKFMKKKMQIFITSDFHSVHINISRSGRNIWSKFNEIFTHCCINLQ